MNCLFVSFNSDTMEHSGIIIVILCGINCIWGESQLVTSKIGGTYADIEDYPFMVGFVVKYLEHHLEELICSGSIIGKYWTITAAGCASLIMYHDALDNQRGFVRGNTTFWYENTYSSNFSNTPYARDHLILHFITHKLYKAKEWDYDVALVKVKEPFSGVFEGVISYATVDHKYFTGSDAKALIWKTGPFTAMSSDRGNFIKLKPDKFCPCFSEAHRKVLTPRMICGGASGKYFHQHGGPLIQFAPYPLLIGLRSCNDWRVPRLNTIYTNLGAVHGWIVDRLLREEYKTNGWRDIWKL